MALVASNNVFPNILLDEAADETDPTPNALPAAGQRRLIVGPDHLLYLLDDAGDATLVGSAGVADILDLPTAEMDDTLVLAPDGAGGVEFRAESGGGGGEFTETAAVVLTSGNLTTTSTSFVDATGLTVTLTTAAVRCLVFFQCAITNSTATEHVAVDIAVDGTRMGQAYGLAFARPVAAGDYTMLPVTVLTAVLSAASHTIKVQWRVGSGTGTMSASTALAPAMLRVIETSMAT